MPIESFNERALDNGKVPGSGSRGGSTPSGPSGSARGIPKGVKQSAGTENLGATTVTKQAAPRSVPSGKDSRPKAVDTFSDRSV